MKIKANITLFTLLWSGLTFCCPFRDLPPDARQRAEELAASQSSSETLDPETFLASRYASFEKMEGAQADTYRVETAEGEVFAIKFIKTQQTAPENRIPDRNNALRLEAEISEAAHGENPGAPVSVYHELNGIGYTITPWAGASLKSNLATQYGANATTSQLLEGFQHLAERVGQLHNNNIIHRDLKPGNITVDPNTPAGENPFRIIDFGTSSHNGRTPIREGYTAGSPLYAPESQLLGAPPNRQHDLYSLHKVMLEMAFGKPLHEINRMMNNDLTIAHRRTTQGFSYITREIEETLNLNLDLGISRILNHPVSSTSELQSLISRAQQSVASTGSTAEFNRYYEQELLGELAKTNIAETGMILRNNPDLMTKFLSKEILGTGQERFQIGDFLGFPREILD